MTQSGDYFSLHFILILTEKYINESYTSRNRNEASFLYLVQSSENDIFIRQSSTDVTIYKNLLDTKFQDLDNNEYTNYHHNTFLLMLFDRWQHCRQMSDTARNLFYLSSLTDINNDTFINNTAYLASIIQQNSKTMNSLIVCMDLLNNVFKQIQHMTTSNSTASVDDTCQEVYQQLHSSWTNSFDDLDKELNKIYALFQTLDIPLVWLQSPLFDWKQTNIDNDLHQQFLTNFFVMSKIATMRQVCQLIIDHSQTFNNVKSQITNDDDISTIIVQYLADLPSLVTSYLMFSLISSSQSILEKTVIQTDYQFQDSLITPTNQLAEIQQILAQINDI
ncbi:unnamed protein product [Rotaria socialis]|uniref:Uncharacterized protein n=1 Tax=Rotaria socialis TaxID=392032 RepID=A0A820RTK6_9BILA|nr:unnamed protein product [Rotaria socialis]